MSAHPNDLFTAFLKAREVSESLLMAYSDDPNGPVSMRDIRLRAAESEFVKLAGALGYSVAKIEPAVLEAAE